MHGFPGYDVSVGMPTVVQVLDGAPPANTAPIRVDTTPGAIWRYSGGGFTVMQQMVIDVTGQPFPQFLQKTVLGPIGMTSSSFEQPQPNAARGAHRRRLLRRRLAGAWTLARVSRDGRGRLVDHADRPARSGRSRSRRRSRDAATASSPQQWRVSSSRSRKAGAASASACRGPGKSLRFSHGGRDEGFDALLDSRCGDRRRRGDHDQCERQLRLMGRVRDYVERSWAFSNVTSPRRRRASATAPVRIDRSRLATYAGYYEAAENNMVALVPNPDGSGMQVLVDGLPDENLLAMDSTTFGSNERAFRVRFSVGWSRAPSPGVTLRPGEPRERRAPRVAPLPSALAAARGSRPRTRANGSWRRSTPCDKGARRWPPRPTSRPGPSRTSAAGRIQR